MRSLTRVLWCLLWLLPWVVAQSQPSVADVARKAVQDWQAGAFLSQGTPQTPEEAIRLLERQIAFLPAPRGLEVNLEEPSISEETNRTLVSFPASIGNEGGEVVVTLRGGEVTRVAFQSELGRLPTWLSSPVAWGLFIAFSLLVFAGIFRKGWLRDRWQEGWAVVREHWRLYISLNVLLYGLFALGSLVAIGQPELVRLAQEVVRGALEQIGLSEGQPRGPLELALLIFYWNFQQGLIATTALPGLLLGIPALLINMFRYFLLGFALSPVAFPTQAYLFHVPTIVIELQAYILATFGGMVILAKVLRGKGYRAGLRASVLTVLLGGVFLLVGAWYEAFSVLYLMR